MRLFLLINLYQIIEKDKKEKVIIPINVALFHLSVVISRVEGQICRNFPTAQTIV